MTVILKGKEIAKNIREQVSASVVEYISKSITPTLAIVSATTSESTEYYTRHIVKAAESCGIKTILTALDPSSSHEQIAEAVQKLAIDASVHGIILQTPLPTNTKPDELRSLIPVSKDVDGANPLSAGRLMSGIDAFAPTTAVAVMEILKVHKIPLAGQTVVIIGRSLVVGKPLAHLMLSADATVTICHSKTANLPAVCHDADILVVAIGKAEFVNADYIKKGAVVIDVGTNATPTGLVGDVDSASVHDIAEALSPVPGGVGPVTTALLLKQTLQAVDQQLIS